MSERERRPGGTEEIIRKIGETAASYTPEWDFNPEDPDIGSALALAYADMLGETARQMDWLGYKNQLALFGSLGAERKPAVPARGYAVFSVMEGAPGGTEVDAHTSMTADLEGEEGGNAQYETLEDLYAVPAEPSCLYLADGRQDAIYCVSENIMEEQASLLLFREKGENLQRHELVLTHGELLDIRNEAYLELGLYAREGQPAEKKFLEALADPAAARFSYWTEEGWRPFDGVSLIGDRLLLHKNTFSPGFSRTELEGRETYALRCEALDASRTSGLSVEEIRLRGRGERLAPQIVYGAGNQCVLKEYFPFGERLNLYEEVYFGSGEALSKRGARISLSFSVDFVQIPLDTNGEESEIEWKWIMKRSDFRPDPEYDVAVEEVIWEYYNGSGWNRLFPDGAHEDAFSPRGGVIGRQRTLVFDCPRDMEPVLVDSCETCYIRARILKISNLYKLKGQYIVPVLGNTMFSYAYPETGERPEGLLMENNLERRSLWGAQMEALKEGLHPFPGMEEEQKALYLGFERAPVGSPIQMLLVLEDMLPGKQGGISWEYLSARGFKELNLADGTRNLSRTGLVTFVGPSGFHRESRFGRELYWIRLRDETDFYRKENVEVRYPALRQLFMNAARIRHMDREETEYFTLDYYDDSRLFALMRGNVSEIEVEVLEGAEGEARWMPWQETENLEDEPGGARVYQADRIRGRVQFGNGTHGRVPPLGRADGIRIHYKCGGGSQANVRAGQVNRLNQTMGYVTGVRNPEGLSGGLDVEDIRETLRRSGARLRHQGRAVTARDYEELAREASRTLEKVRCFGGCNAKGGKEAGAVTLVVLPRDFRSDKSLLYSVQAEIERYLEPRMDPGILARNQFAVIGPLFVEIEVRAELGVESFQDIFQVRRKAQESLKAFLDPISGHFDGKGWKIGELPGAMQIQNALKEIPETAFIQKLYLITYINGEKGRQEVDPDRIRKHPYVLPLSGTHEINVIVRKTGR